MPEIRITNNLIRLQNNQISYCIFLTETGHPIHLYFGKRLHDVNPATILRRYGMPLDGSLSLHECILDQVPQEYPSFGLGDMREGALSICGNDGTRACDLRFLSALVTEGKPKLSGLPATFGENCKTLLLQLQDELLNLNVTLSYSIFDDCSAIVRSVQIKNQGHESLTIERALSFSMDLPDTRFDVITLSGTACRERNLICRPLSWGQTRVSSLRGASSAQNSPFLALVRPHTTEAQGEVIAASLVF